MPNYYLDQVQWIIQNPTITRYVTPLISPISDSYRNSDQIGWLFWSFSLRSAEQDKAILRPTRSASNLYLVEISSNYFLVTIVRKLMSFLPSISQMSSRINSSNLPIPHGLPTNSPRFNTSSNSLKFKSRPHSVPSSYSSPSSQESLDKVKQSPDAWNVKFETLEGCKLGISRYPDFEYNAKGGIGTAIGRIEEDKARNDDTMSVSFEAGTLYIPPLTGATTKFLGLPLPPFLKIDIVPEFFQGTISKGSGKVSN